MPELPDIVLYLEALQPRIQGQTLERIRLANPFLLRSALPPIQEAEGKTILDPCGLYVLELDHSQFREILQRTNHTLKRALTDPRLLSGIGNAYSDEILHSARLSPLMLTRSLSDTASIRLFHATRQTLKD